MAAWWETLVASLGGVVGECARELWAQPGARQTCHRCPQAVALQLAAVVALPPAVACAAEHRAHTCALSQASSCSWRQ